MKHTPGPWKVLPGIEVLFIAADGLEEYRVVATAHLDEDILKPECEDNAKLLAASPVMLEALEEIADTCETFAKSDNMAGRLHEIATRAVETAK